MSDALAQQIRSELSDDAPQGFLFSDQVVRQDAALGRLEARLRAHPDNTEVRAALKRAIEDEKDGWTLLKLLELAERLTYLETAEPLLRLAAQPLAEDDRSRFLSGRACEVLLKLPLDLATRTQANQVCRAPLEAIARFRLGAQAAQKIHRPRQVEWVLLAALMLAALAGLVLAWRAL